MSTLVVLLLLLCHAAVGDYYSSLLNTEKLFATEDKMIKNIEVYIQSAEKLLEQCERALDIWQKTHEKDMADPEEFVKIPNNGFKLIKRNTVDLDLIVQKFLKQPTVNDIFNVTENIFDILPDENDLYECSWSIAKLGFMYNLTFTSMLIDGEIGLDEEWYQHTPLRGDEIIVYFWQLYTNRFNIFHYISDEFFYMIEEAMQDVSKMTDKKKLNSTLSMYVKMMEILMYDDVSPYMLKAVNKITLKILGEDQQILELDDKIDSEIYHLEYEDEDRVKTKIYQELCYGQRERSAKLLSQLKCYYKSHSFHLLISPIKVEQLNLEPEILLFHEILTEGEMEELKSTAVPNMERSLVTYTGSKLEKDAVVSNIRLTHSAKLTDEDSKVVHDIRYRAEDVTGLAKEGFEKLAINVYGIGGYYLYHMDSSYNETKKRAATLLFYLSDVVLGGATVFPYFNLTVQARKGSALLFYNTHTSGQIDYRMTHSACPVLLGYKWIATYWIRQQNQTFSRPCIPNEYHTSIEDFVQSQVVIPQLQKQ